MGRDGLGCVEDVGMELLTGALLQGEDALCDDESGLVGDGLVGRLHHVLESAEGELVGVCGMCDALVGVG